MSRDCRELLGVSAGVSLVSLLLWWRFLPLPHIDLNFYTEPAYLLARYGTLAGPGSQHLDLTYQKGMYFYPPGYFLALAAWIKLFGLSADSLLAYTHAVHTGFLVGLYALLRFRYSCLPIVSALVLLATLPAMNHGRPDLTACLFSVLAWLTLPGGAEIPRLALSGFFVGATMLVSPAYGIGIVLTLAVIMATDGTAPLAARLRSLALWLGFSGLTFAIVLVGVFLSQHSWEAAYVQFTTNVAIRGHELNVLPRMETLFAWAFTIVPLFLLAVVPAFFVVLLVWRKSSSPLRSVSLAFLISTAAWLAFNRGQFLYEHHYLFVTKAVFLGMLFSLPLFPRWLRPAPLLLLVAISLYKYKADFLYLDSPLRDSERKYSASVHPSGEVAVDSLYFSRFYRPGSTLNYELLDLHYWPRYLAAIPKRLQHDMLLGLQPEPLEPSMLLVSAATIQRLGEPRYPDIRCTPAFGDQVPLTILGRAWKLPADPYALMVCQKVGP